MFELNFSISCFNLDFLNTSNISYSSLSIISFCSRHCTYLLINFTRDKIKISIIMKRRNGSTIAKYLIFINMWRKWLSTVVRNLIDFLREKFLFMHWILFPRISFILLEYKRLRGIFCEILPDLHLVTLHRHQRKF